jgi:hypothetical protein
MSETNFTRADWRPGKRRRTYVRVKPYGGRKEAPPAFLAAVKLHAIGAPLDKRARCAGKRRDGCRCGMIALNGSTFCRRHGGAMSAKLTRPYVAVAWRNGR